LPIDRVPSGGGIAFAERIGSPCYKGSGKYDPEKTPSLKATSNKKLDAWVSAQPAGYYYVSLDLP
jgi:hypothetical protein